MSLELGAWSWSWGGYTRVGTVGGFWLAGKGQLCLADGEGCSLALFFLAPCCVYLGGVVWCGVVWLVMVCMDVVGYTVILDIDARSPSLFYSGESE